MKAVVCRSFGTIEDLALEELPDPKPGQRQIRVRVDAAGVNFPDTLIVQGLYQFKPPFPFSPGGEIAGEVLEVGEGVEGIEVGDRVAATMIWGGYAEQVVVEAAQAVKLPDTMPTDIAGGFFLTYLTTYHGLVDRARLQPGETLAVLGAAGGTGLSAVELGKALGARVIACASSPEKLELCRAHGADVGIDYSHTDLKTELKKATDGEGVDVLY
ncbi:MAG: NADPH:quinone oxidoreductase family protein, partial [Myxococcota bacterium]